MITNNLLEFLNDLQKFMVKIKIQETINTLIKDDRVHNVIDADVVLEYYKKMHEHFDKIPEDFLFPNSEWLDESLKRLNIDLSDTFDESANPNQIKREELITLFLILWVNMKIQDPVSCENIEEPYELFNLWVKNRVLVIRPTKETYLHRSDHSVLNHVYKNYGWYTKLVHTFNIDKKGEVKYNYNSPDGIVNIDKMYKRAINKLTDDALEEKERRNIIIPRNTKFIVREMSGLSNKEYKQLLKYYHTNELKKANDPYIKEIVDVLAENYSIEIDSDFISYAKRHAKPKPDSSFQTIAIIDIINAMIKLKKKVGGKEDE